MLSEKERVNNAIHYQLLILLHAVCYQLSVTSRQLISQPHQRLREYRFYVNIGRGVKTGCDRGFYMTDVFTLCF